MLEKRGIKEIRILQKRKKQPKEKSKIAEVLYRAGDISVARIANQLKVSSPTVYVYLKYRGVEIGKSPIKKVLTCQTQTN